MSAQDDRSVTDEDLLRSLYAPLRAFAAVVGPREVAPDDLLHDAIVRTLRRGPLRDLDEPGPYLRRAILNEASNQRRRLGRRRAAFVRLAGGASSAARDAYPTDLSYLDRLDPRARAVVYLHDVDGYPYDHIAAELQLTEANTRQIASRARAQIRHHLQDQP